MSEKAGRVTMSYVIATRNKLPYLKVVMERLTQIISEDEEIVVVDGDSTDGTPDYLRQLQLSGKISRFISEPDQGEAHALNKAILLAEGKLIKNITDDDVFHWPSIRAAKQFMLEHDEIDLLGGNVAFTVLAPGFDTIIPAQHEQSDYLSWLSTGRPFPCVGITLLLRRSSLPLMGLFNPGFRAVDYEFTMRASSIVNMAWYTALCAVRVQNQASNYQFESEPFEQERERLYHFYKHKLPLRRWLHYKRLRLDRMKRRVAEALGVPVGTSKRPPDIGFAEFYDLILEKIDRMNCQSPGEFLLRKQSAS